MTYAKRLEKVADRVEGIAGELARVAEAIFARRARSRKAGGDVD